MRTLHLICFLVGIHFAFSQFPETDLIFDGGELGILKGDQYVTSVLNRPIIQLKGIPYAKPLTKDGRFLPSEELDTLPLVPSPEIFDASRNGPCCPQTFSNILCMAQGRQNEDCLKMNIYTPVAQKDIQAPGLPVIIFIHGGAFTLGSADFYNGNRLLDEDVIVVNFNYRLGVLGFFYLEDDQAPGNAAMYDMVQALKFVKKYIHHFGGDPDRITITGQSAGSVSVTQLLLSPLSRNSSLFHRAIAVSGTALNEWGTTVGEKSEKASLEIATMLGCYDGYSLPVNKPEIVQCMKEVDMRELVDVLDFYQLKENNQGRLGFDPVTPVIQGEGVTIEKFLDEAPDAVLERKAAANVPLIIGSTQHDGSFVLGIEWNKFITFNSYENNPVFLRTELVPTLLKALGIQDKTGAIFQLLATSYLGAEARDSGDFTQMIPGLTDLHTVFFFKAAALRTLELHSRYQPNSYWYNFDYKGAFTVYSTIVNMTNNPVRGGIGHGDDLLYLFTIPFSDQLNEQDQEISKRLVKYWANFAYTGNPNTPDSETRRVNPRFRPEVQNIEWPAYSEMAPAYAVINTTDTVVEGNPSDIWIGASDDLWADVKQRPRTEE